MRKRYGVVAAILAGVLAVTGVAHAAEETTASNVVIDGVGTLVAHGRGHVELTGRGWAKFVMHGDITVTIGDDTKVIIRALDQDPEVVTDATTISLDDFTGVIVVRGARFHVSAKGRFRRIKAAGTGVAFLQGRGWYRATGGYYGTWTKPGLRVTYSL
jgi:hypothetical protein